MSAHVPVCAIRGIAKLIRAGGARCAAAGYTKGVAR